MPQLQSRVVMSSAATSEVLVKHVDTLAHQVPSLKLELGAWHLLDRDKAHCLVIATTVPIFFVLKSFKQKIFNSKVK